MFFTMIMLKRLLCWENPPLGVLHYTQILHPEFSNSCSLSDKNSSTKQNTKFEQTKNKIHDSTVSLINILVSDENKLKLFLAILLDEAKFVAADMSTSISFEYVKKVEITKFGHKKEIGNYTLSGSTTFTDQIDDNVKNFIFYNLEMAIEKMAKIEIKEIHSDVLKKWKTQNTIDGFETFIEIVSKNGIYHLVQTIALVYNLKWAFLQDNTEKSFSKFLKLYTKMLKISTKITNLKNFSSEKFRKKHKNNMRFLRRIRNIKKEFFFEYKILLMLYRYNQIRREMNSILYSIILPDLRKVFKFNLKKKLELENLIKEANKELNAIPKELIKGKVNELQSKNFISKEQISEIASLFNTNLTYSACLLKTVEFLRTMKKWDYEKYQNLELKAQNSVLDDFDTYFANTFIRGICIENMSLKEEILKECQLERISQALSITICLFKSRFATKRIVNAFEDCYRILYYKNWLLENGCTDKIDDYIRKVEGELFGKNFHILVYFLIENI